MWLFHRYGFHEYHGLGRGGVWAHNPAHRLGVPYANRGIAERFRGGEFRRAAPERARNFGGIERNESAGSRFGSRGFEQRNSGENHSVFGGIHNGGETRMQSDHGFSSMRGGFGGFGGGGGRARGGGRR